MARGWESKSVESQMDAAEERKADAQRLQQNEAQIRSERQRESLELSRGRILREMEATHHPRHREQLSAALRFLDEQLLKLQG